MKRFDGHEKLAANLFRANVELKAMLDSGEACMSTAEAVRTYQTINENTHKAAELKEKACQLLEEIGQLSAADEAALRAAGQRLATKALIEEEIQWYQRRCQSSGS